MQRLGLMVATLAVAGAGCSGGSDTPSTIRPVDVTVLAAPGILAYDVAPNGAWLAVDGPDRSICLVPIDDAQDGIELDPPSTDTVCSSEGTGGVARWSPDSGRVVISDFVFRFLRSAPLTLLDTEGNETTLAPAVPDADRIIGSAFGPTFVDDDTVIFGRVLDDPIRPEYSTIAVDGSEEEVAFVLSNPRGDDPWLPFFAPIADEDTLLLPIGDTVGEPVDIWSIDLDDGEATQLTDERRDRDTSGFGSLALAPVDLSDDHLLVIDANASGDFLRAAGDITLFSLVDRDDETFTPIADRPGESHRFATLSPEGAFLATVSIDLERRVESTLLIASVETVLDGEPDWQELSLGDRPTGSIDLGAVGGSLRWDQDDALLLETPDELLRIDLERG